MHLIKINRKYCNYAATISSGRVVRSKNMTDASLIKFGFLCGNTKVGNDWGAVDMKIVVNVHNQMNAILIMSTIIPTLLSNKWCSK